MRAGGIDIGSRTVKLVEVDAAGHVLTSAKVDTTPDVTGDCLRMLSSRQLDRFLATGYGRSLAEIEFSASSVTEIKAHARGAEAATPGCRTVLDLGGQDMKAIALDGTGRVQRFEMNDRCAAGAGRFLEMMAGVLRYDIEDFGRAALEGSDTVSLSSMCAVFAESEVVGLLTKGRRRDDIARAAHRAIARRACSMLGRVQAQPPVVFSGGGALNVCLVRFIEEGLGWPLVVPREPQMIGAFGAALLALGTPAPPTNSIRA